MNTRTDAGRVRAAWTLALLTTLCAELTFTAVAVPFTWVLLPLLLLMYGAGVLVVREAVVRAGAGWPGLVLLGLAYELAEDGLGLQALTSPRLYGAADWGWRALGVNWTYWASQIGVHVVFSVLVPVVLADLLFPHLRGRPYVRRGGLVTACVLAVAGVVGLRYVLAATQDPGYRAPWTWMVGLVVAIAVLAVLALRVLPRHRLPEPNPAGSVPQPAVVGLLAAVATIVFLGLLLPPGLGPELMFGAGVPQPLRLVLAALVAIGSGWAVLRWGRAPGWTDLRRIWLVGGILVAHTAFMMPASHVAVLAGLATIVVEVVLLVVLARRVSRSAGARADLDPPRRP